MIENVKLYSKIGAKSFLKWLAIIAVGCIVTLIFFLIVLFQNISGHGSFTAFVSDLLSDNLAGFIIVAGSPLFIILYFVIAHKYATESAVYEVWKSKAEQVVGDAIKALVDKLLTKAKTVESISNASILRLRLLDENSKHPETSRLKRNLINYIIRKIQLDDIDFSNKELRLSDIIANKVNNFISENSEPSLKFFWILTVSQIAIFIMSQFH